MIPTHWTQNDLTLNGNKFHYTRTGNGGKPPLILVHGFSDNGLCWLQTARDLEADYDIIMPDARGHGLSARIRPGETVDMTADLAAIIQALGIEQPIVAGHSMGAMEAFQLGVRYPSIPRALILEDPPWWQPNTRPVINKSDEHPQAPWVATVQRLTLDELIEQTRRDHPTWPDWVIETWCPAKKELDPYILSILNIRGDDWQADIPKLACPTLIITADPARGGIVTPEIAEQAAALNPRCRVEHLPGTGHHVRFEDYTTYMTIVQDFLKAVES